MRPIFRRPCEIGCGIFYHLPTHETDDLLIPTDATILRPFCRSVTARVRLVFSARAVAPFAVTRAVAPFSRATPHGEGKAEPESHASASLFPAPI